MGLAYGKLAKDSVTNECNNGTLLRTRIHDFLSRTLGLRKLQLRAREWISVETKSVRFHLPIKALGIASIPETEKGSFDDVVATAFHEGIKIDGMRVRSDNSRSCTLTNYLLDGLYLLALSNRKHSETKNLATRITLNRLSNVHPSVGRLNVEKSKLTKNKSVGTAIQNSNEESLSDYSVNRQDEMVREEIQESAYHMRLVLSWLRDSWRLAQQKQLEIEKKWSDTLDKELALDLDKARNTSEMDALATGWACVNRWNQVREKMFPVIISV